LFKGKLQSELFRSKYLLNWLVSLNYTSIFRALNNCKSNVKLKVVKNCQSFPITTCLRFGRRSVCFMHFFKTQLEMIGNFLQFLVPVNVKTVQMLFNVVWSFLLTVWTTAMRFCAELITRHTESQTHLKLGEVSSRWSYPLEGF
jgi:hypothetical protein